MKKDRNSFFESNYNMQASYHMPNMMMPPNQMPNFETPNTNNYTNNYNNYQSSELESRIAKIERNINRLDARLSKLEGTTYYSNVENDSNMYMI